MSNNLIGQNITNNIQFQITKDTSISIFSNSLLDFNNTNIFSYTYEPKYYPTKQPLKKISFTNEDSVSLAHFSFYINKYYYTNQDSLIQQIFNGANTSEEKAFFAYNFLKDRTLYFFYPENKLGDNNYSYQESHGLLKFINIYGYGACGTHGVNLARINALFSKQRQYSMEIQSGAHSTSQINYGNNSFYMDADREAFYVLNNGKLASFKDVFLDPFLYVRTKLFSNSSNYIIPDSSLINNYYNYQNPIDSNNVFTNIINQSDSNNIKKIDFSILPNTTISFFPDSINYNYHINNTTISDQFKKDNLKNVARTGYILQKINNNISLQKVSSYQQNIQKVGTKIFPIINTNLSSIIFHIQSPYTINNGFINFNEYLNSNADSLKIFYSIDSLNWNLLFLSDSIQKNTVKSYSLPLLNFIRPDSLKSCYSYFIKFELFSNSLNTNCFIDTVSINTKFQYSKFTGPTFEKGENKLHIYPSSTNATVKTQIEWVDYLDNTPPLPPQNAIFPQNNQIVNTTNFAFHWSPSTDNQDSILTYQIQVSERPDFLYPISPNFDRILYFNSSPITYFTPEIKNFYIPNTQYYWRVRSQDNRGAWSEWSTSWQFTVKAPTTPKNLHFEINNTIGVDTFYLKWDAPPLQDSIVKYYIYTNDTRGFGINISTNSLIDSTFSPSYKLVNLFNRYKYRVVAVASNGDKSAPSYNINHPILTSINTQLNSNEISLNYFKNKLNLNTIPTTNSDRLPWPVVSGDYRENFIWEDTSNFNKINDSTYTINFIGNKLLNCYTKIYDDTVTQFQIYYKSSITYDCATQKAKITFPLLGSPPWVLNYTLNGITNTFTTSFSNLSFLASNGAYSFNYYLDNNNVIHQLNKNFNINYKALSFSNTNPIYNCDSNKTMIHFNLNGNAPWTIYYRKNNINHIINTSVSSFDYYFDNGLFSFDSLKDATCSKNISPTINYSFNYIPNTATITSPFYNCDSNKTFVHIDVQGNAPFTYLYSKNGINDSITTYANSIDKYFENGTYFFNQITDSTNCISVFNQNHTFNYLPLSYFLSNPIYSCDSNKTLIHFDLQGNSPWSIYYQKNSNNQQIITSDSSFDYYLDNGIYSFDSIKDLTCLKNIGQQFTFNFTPISAQISTPIYNCDSNKTFVHIDVQGNAPFTYLYSKNGINDSITTYANTIDKYFENGTYFFNQITDSTNCISVFNQNHTFNYLPLSYFLSNPIYSCDSNKTLIHFDLQGNSPWSIYYQKNSNNQQIITSDSSFDYYLDNGIYSFDSIKDLTCLKNIGQQFTFNFTPISAQISTPIYNCDSNKTFVHIDVQGNAPFTYLYSKNGINDSITTYANTIDKYFENGTYFFNQITDSTNCISVFNQNYTFNYLPLSYFLSNPIYSCDSNKTLIHFNLQGNAPWSIYYQKNSNNQQIITSDSSFDYYLDNGIYSFDSIKDLTCLKNIGQQFTFNFTPISAQISTPIYNCDSNKTLIHIDLQGNPPFNIPFTNNGIATPFTTFSNSFDKYFENGVYNFTQISDSTNCNLVLINNFTFNFDTLGYFIGLPIYNCDSNKTTIHFDMHGNGPWIIYYRKNNIDQIIYSLVPSFDYLFSNNNYIFDSISDATCTRLVSPAVQYTFNYIPISSTISTLIYNCDSNKTALTFNILGNAPFTYYYLYNGVQTQLLSSSNTFSKLFSNGNYIFYKITDSTNCVKNTNDSITINYQPLSSIISSPIYISDSNKTKIHFNLTGNSPWTIYYTRNNIALHVITTYSLFDYFVSNGIYTFDSIYDATCHEQLLPPQTFNIHNYPLSNPTDLNNDKNILLFPNPAKNIIHIVVGDSIKYNWNYTIFDMFGNKIISNNSTNFEEYFDVSHLSNGIYTIHFNYSIGNYYEKKVIKFTKE